MARPSQAAEALLARARNAKSSAEMLDLTPADARRIARFGMALAAQGDEAGALEAAGVAIAVDPEGIAPCMLMGRLLARRKRYREALEFYQRVLAKNDQQVRVLV